MVGSTDKDMEMTGEEFIMIRDFIHERSGIYFAENKEYLVRNRLAKRMADLGIKTVRDYFYHVKYDVSLKEFNRLMTLVTTNETSFFRNEPQLLSFSEEVLPVLIEKKLESPVSRHVKVWSAGCSTGEEPYTLAILMLEKLKSYPGFTVEVIANDISEAVLKKARQGEYAGMTLRNIKPELLATYFTKSGDSYRVKPEVKALVKFSHMNLNEPRKTYHISAADAIFCRNVMIYFSDEVRKQLVRGFYNALNPGGYFFIGHSETLHGISKAFKLVYLKNALVYQKEAAGVADQPRKTTPSEEIRACASGGAQRALDLLSKIRPVTVKT